MRTVKTSVLSADGAVLARRGWFYGCIADGAGAVTIYDNASAASGTKLCTVTPTAATTTISFTLATPVYCQNGIYVDLTGNVVTTFYSDAP